jgi:beta-xylosidase
MARTTTPVHLFLSSVLALILGACGGAGAQSAALAPVAQTPAPAASTLGDFPDPFVLADGDSFYAYATNSQGKNVQLLHSADLRTWSPLPDAMPALASWVRPTDSQVWAPEVIRLGASYVLYYTAHDKASDRQCVGAAAAASPAGPFVDRAQAPLVCQAQLGGTIDPSPLLAGGRLYLYFKSDGNCCRMQTHLYVQELRADGLATSGSPTLLLSNERVWEGAVVEAPTMFVHDGKFLLFYSANDYSGAAYAVGYAACLGPAGPCSAAPENPILKSRSGSAQLVGPGHQDVFQAGDQTWIAYHAWEELAGGVRGNRRFLYLDKVDWVDGKPVVRGPTMAQ